ncbi:MAG: dephospho-CoA kinase [Thermodesulfovibrionales bacterium]|nr:dephospho-CoA kinase [Thermodesulfovibrionales bacterium]
MIRVALTGNIGMGKTTAAKIFQSLGACVVYTDEIVRVLLDKYDVKKRLCEVFGDFVVKDNILDKRVLADIVFRDDCKRMQLEDILHPLVFEEVERVCVRCGKDSIVVVEAPIIFERGYQKSFDKTITVFCDEDIAIKRLLLKGFNKEEATLRLKSQMPISRKCEMSDFVIDNNGSIEDLHRQVTTIYQTLERIKDGRGKRDI